MSTLLVLVGQVCHIDQVQGKHLVDREAWQDVVWDGHQVLSAHALALLFDRHLVLLYFNHGVLDGFFDFKQDLVQFIFARGLICEPGQSRVVL